MDDTTLKALAKLREPFAPNQISKLCRSTKKDNPKGSCRVCGGYHGLPAIALDYVGHAALTDRLLDADPLWTWEPLALDGNGSPLIDKDGGMWIKLTVAGVTRLGYGDAQGKQGGDAMKERIGDALRNAAMRFGAALDLWHKGELHVDESEPQQRQQAPKSSAQGAEQRQASEPLSEAQKSLLESLQTIFHGNEQEMGDALRTCSTFKAKDKENPEKDVERYLTLVDLRKPNANEKFQRWVGSALGKLRADSGLPT